MTVDDPENEVLESELVEDAPVIRPRLWPIFAVSLAALVFYIVFAGLAIVVAALVTHGPFNPLQLRDREFVTSATQTGLGFFCMVVIPQIAMTIPVWIAASRSVEPFRERLQLLRGHWPIGLWVCAAIATPLVGVISASLFSRFLPESENLVELSGLFQKLSEAGWLIPLALVIGATPGVCEEILFRGYIQTRVTKRWNGAIGILIASVLFAAFHMDLVHSLSVFPLGVWLGWICYQSGSVFPAMLAHFYNNAISVFAAALAAGMDPEKPTVAVGAISMLILVGGATAMATTLLRFRRYGAAAPATEFVA